MKPDTVSPSPSTIARVRNEWARLLRALKRGIRDEYRASEEDDAPGMQVTFGVTLKEDGSLSWHYQTGDNSYSGGAYGHPVWAVVSLYRRSNSRALAKEAMEEALSQF